MAFKQPETELDMARHFYSHMTPQQINDIQNKVNNVLGEQARAMRPGIADSNLIANVKAAQQAMKIAPANCDGQWGARTDIRYQGFEAAKGVDRVLNAPAPEQKSGVVVTIGKIEFLKEPEIKLTIGKVQFVKPEKTESETVAQVRDLGVMEPIIIPVREKKQPVQKKPAVPPVTVARADVHSEEAESLPESAERQKYQITMESKGNYRVVFVSDRPYHKLSLREKGDQIRRAAYGSTTDLKVYDPSGQLVTLPSGARADIFHKQMGDQVFVFKKQRPIEG